MKKTKFVTILLLLCSVASAAMAGVSLQGTYTPSYALVNNPNDTGVVFYSDAREDSEEVGFYYNGVKVDLVGYYNEWTMVYLGGTDEPLHEGFVRTKLLSFGKKGNPEDVVSEKPLAVVTNEDGARVYINPDAQTTMGVIAEGVEFEIMGYSNGWYHVDALTDEAWFLGFVSEDDVALTESVAEIQATVLTNVVNNPN